MILLVAAALGGESPDWHAAQARHFLKKGWTDDAEAEVALGLATDAQHVELNAICVELARLEGNIDRALRCAAAGASADVGDLDTRAGLSQMELWLRANYGWIEISGPTGRGTTRLSMEATSMQLDADLQAAAATASRRLASGVTLPLRLALPAGDYTILSLPTHIEAGQTVKLALPGVRLEAGHPGDHRLEVAVGVLAFSGANLANHLPGMSTEIAFSLSAPGIRVGFGATWDLRAYSGVGLGSEPAVNTGGGLVRLSVPLEVAGELTFSPAFAMRAAMLPGVELACTQTEPRYACIPGAPQGSDLPVYANAFGVVPQGELGAEVKHGRWTLGLRGSVGHVFAFLPDPGEVVLPDGSVSEWKSDPIDLHGAVYGAAAMIAWGFE